MSAAPYEHIACCLEDSPGSRRALQEAQRLRASGPGRLTIVHVTPPPIIYGESLGLPPEDEITDVASAWLTNELERIDGGESVLLSGHPASTVCAGHAKRARTCSSPAPTAAPSSASPLAASPATSPTTHPAPCS